MDRKIISNIFAAWQEVVNEKKKLDPVDDKELKGKFKDRDDKDIDNDGDTDGSDEYLHNRRATIKKKMKHSKSGKLGGHDVEESKVKENDDEIEPNKDGMKPCPECDGSMDNHNEECSRYKGEKKQESSDLDAKEVGKALKHDCASHVTSEQWGYGECIPGQHTLEEQEDGSAIVTHYDVMFEHGVEFNVPVENLKIVAEKSHSHKKVKESFAAEKQKKSAQKKGGHEGIMDKESGIGKQMSKDIDGDNPDKDDSEEKGHDDATRAGRVTKQAPARNGDQLKVGDKSPPKASK
jgi:hypothetical protein